METRQKRPITRRRELRACSECRIRKLKCDRRSPCGSCIRRDKENASTCCLYAGKLDGRRDERQDHSSQAEERLEHLEQLVQQLSRSQTRNGQGSSNQAASVTAMGLRDSSGHSADPVPDISYGETHWSAMLDDIEELRNAIQYRDASGDEDKDIDDPGHDGMDILFGGTSRLPMDEIILRFLPPRQIVDRLVGLYFRTASVAAPFLHTGQFRRLYQKFWEGPTTIYPLWVSILFTVLDIAARSLSSSPHSVTSLGQEKAFVRFDSAAAHCLVIGQYSRPQNFAVEALLLYAQSRCLVGSDLGSDIVILLGTVVRLATVMSYHRDPDESGQVLSVFEKEMRRRTWSMCMQLDVIVSFQLGLPSSIPVWSTRPPTNLLDSEFDESSVELPPARPMTEQTELLFYIAKHQLLAVFEKILRHTLSGTRTCNDEVVSLDREVRHAYATLPSDFQARPMEDSALDSPLVKVARLCVYFIKMKCLCVLHRKYVARGRQASLSICHQSALDLVTRFLDMYEEFEPGGQLETERWFMGSLTWHDFLLACATLCFTICYTRHASFQIDSLGAINVDDSLMLLSTAQKVCEEQLHRRKDTLKIRRLIDATRIKFKDQVNRQEPCVRQNRHRDMFSQQSSLEVTGDDQTWGWRAMEMSDDGWSFMEQFLDLSDDAVMPDFTLNT